MTATAAKRWALNSQLLLAIQNSDVTRALKLFNEGVDTDTRFCINSEKRPAICICVENNDIRMAKLMIGRGAGVNQFDSNGQTALHITCEYGYHSIAQLLLNNRADIHCKNQYGQTALHLASKMGRTDLVELLISYGADVNKVDKLGRTPLHEAANAIRSQGIKNLLEAGADARIEDHHGNTPLHFAVDSLGTDIEGIEALSSAYPWAALKHNEVKKTPLHVVVSADRRGDQEALEAMLNNMFSKGIKNLPSLLSPRSMRGHTPLHLAVLEKKVELVRLLIAAGAEVDTRDQLGRTPLECAVRDMDFKIVSLLLASGASVRRSISRKLLEPRVEDYVISTVLKDAAMKPMKLTSLCRRVISRTWGANMQQRLEDLPRSWRDFLSFREL